MIDEPEKHIAAFASAGAHNITIHIENNPNVYRTLEAIQSLGCSTGITLNPGTPAWAIKGVLPLVDLVLIMSVNPGFSGQKFIPRTVKKLPKSKNDHRYRLTCCHSGGWWLNAETLPAIYQAGARNIVAATAVFKYPQASLPASKPYAIQLPDRLKYKGHDYLCLVLRFQNSYLLL